MDSISTLDNGFLDRHTLDVANNLLGDEAVRQYGLFNVYGPGVRGQQVYNYPVGPNMAQEPMPQQTFDSIFKAFGL